MRLTGQRVKPRMLGGSRSAVVAPSLVVAGNDVLKGGLLFYNTYCLEA